MKIALLIFLGKKEIELSKIYSSDSLSKNLKNEICKYNWMDVSKKEGIIGYYLIAY